MTRLRRFFSNLQPSTIVTWRFRRWYSTYTGCYSCCRCCCSDFGRIFCQFSSATAEARSGFQAAKSDTAEKLSSPEQRCVCWNIRSDSEKSDGYGILKSCRAVAMITATVVDSGPIAQSSPFHWYHVYDDISVGAWTVIAAVVGCFKNDRSNNHTGNSLFRVAVLKIRRFLCECTRAFLNVHLCLCGFVFVFVPCLCVCVCVYEYIIGCICLLGHFGLNAFRRCTWFSREIPLVRWRRAYTSGDRFTIVGRRTKAAFYKE